MIKNGFELSVHLLFSLRRYNANLKIIDHLNCNSFSFYMGVEYNEDNDAQWSSQPQLKIKNLAIKSSTFCIRVLF